MAGDDSVYGSNYRSFADSAPGVSRDESPKKDSKRDKGDGKGATKRVLSAAGSGLQEAGRDLMDSKRSGGGVDYNSYKRGGKVRKTGPANLHKGERVIPRSKVKRVEKMMRKTKMRMKASKRG